MFARRPAFSLEKRSARAIFPEFVRDLGGMWYKVRSCFPLFVARHAAKQVQTHYSY
ncbi:hypothetical protein HMPREF1578_01033 [Gardnerella pickettii JCP8017B]|nr:hypothetical protein HMPREF1578_01033 [Gardnerella pickettii JCP8017B]